MLTAPPAAAVEDLMREVWPVIVTVRLTVCDHREPVRCSPPGSATIDWDFMGLT